MTSPSLPRATPMVPRRGTGALIEDVDGNLFLDFNAGIAVCSTGHAHPRVVEAVGRQAADLLHYSASDFYLPVYSEYAEALAATAPMAGPVAGLPDQLRDRGRRGRAEAGPGGHRPPVRDQLLRRLPRPQLRLGQPDRLQGQVPRRVRAAAPRGAARPLRLLPPLPAQPDLPERGHATVDWLTDTLFRYEVDPGEVAAVFVEPIQGEGGYIIPPPSGWPELRELSASATASCSWPTRSSRAWAGPGGCGRSSTPGSSPTC